MKRLAPLAPWSAPSGLSARTAAKLFVSVPLAAEPGDAAQRPRVLLANFDELRRLGVKVPANDRLTPAFERELLERFALRSTVNPEAPDDAKSLPPSKVTGVATRYQGYPGAVQGDGRAVLVAQAVRHDARGRPRERVDVQVKGVATGLLPRRKDWASRHGKMFLSRAIQEALYADYLDVNGVPSNRWLLVIDSGTSIIRPTDNEPVRVGLHVRSGHFWRMGHLWYLGDDGCALRELVQHVAELAAAERGRRGAPSLRRLYLQLLRRKVCELADAWWLRYAHGSFTPDNIGLFECIDQGTACTVDRTHVSFSAHRMGYGHCPEILMEEDYKRHLPDLLKRAATGAERRALAELPFALTARGWIEARMAFQALRHLGLDERQVRTMLRAHREVALQLWRHVKLLADEVDRGREVMVGRHMSFRARHAARYDVFAALTKVSSLLRFRERWTPRQRVQRLLRVLRPEDDRTGLDLNRALALVQWVDGVADLVLDGLSPRARAAMAELWRERAKALNRRIANLEGGDSLHLADAIVKARIEGASTTQLRARLVAAMREDVVEGPGTALEAARRLRSGRARRLPDGRVVLSSCAEGGVRLEQVSDGVRDVLRVVVGGTRFAWRSRARCGSPCGGAACSSSGALCPRRPRRSSTRCRCLRMAPRASGRASSRATARRRGGSPTEGSASGARCRCCSAASR